MHSVDSRYAWWRLAASVALSAFGAVGMWGVVVIFPNLQAEFAATRAEVSFSYTTTMLGFGAGSILLGRLIDTKGAFVTMLLSTVLIAGGYALASLAPSLTVFALLQAVIGVGSGAAFIPLVADISHWFAKRRALAMAICASGNYIGGAAWPKITEVVAHQYDWRTAYLVVAVACFVGMLPACLVLRPRSPAHCRGRGRRAALRRARSASRPTACSSGSASPASAAASPWRCRRSISSPTASTSATAPRAARRCCRS